MKEFIQDALKELVAWIIKEPDQFAILLVFIYCMACIAYILIDTLFFDL